MTCHKCRLLSHRVEHSLNTQPFSKMSINIMLTIEVTLILYVFSD